VAETSIPNKQTILNIGILLGLCFLLLFWKLGELPFFSRGEPREGLVVWEMYSSGNWILPAVNGDYIPFKPPLFHWFGVFAAHLFGHIDEFSLRLPSAVFATLGVLMTYLAARRLWGERAAIVAGIVLVTNAEWWQAGTDTQVDMTLAFFISAACLYFYFLYEQRDFGLVKCLGLPLLLGLATLSKGPVGLAVPCLVFLIFLGLRRDFAFVKKLHPFASAAVFLLIAGSWYGAALWQGGPAFFFRQIVDETFRTAVGSYGHFQPVYYYLPIFLENTLPWSFFYPALALFIYQRRDKLSDEKRIVGQARRLHSPALSGHCPAVWRLVAAPRRKPRASLLAGARDRFFRRCFLFARFDHVVFLLRCRERVGRSKALRLHDQIQQSLAHPALPYAAHPARNRVPGALRERPVLSHLDTV